MTGFFGVYSWLVVHLFVSTWRTALQVILGRGREKYLLCNFPSGSWPSKEVKRNVLRPSFRVGIKVNIFGFNVLRATRQLCQDAVFFLKKKKSRDLRMLLLTSIKGE